MSCTPLDSSAAKSAVLAWKGPRSLEEVRRRAGGTVWWAMSTCWWTVERQHLSRHPTAGLPCDPRGSMLMMSEDVEGFLEQAGANWGHYGAYGCTAFLAACHGNLVSLEHLLPTSLREWQEYEALLNGWSERLGQQLAAAEEFMRRRWDSTIQVRTEDGEILWQGLREPGSQERAEWSILAHARSEWSLKNLLTCAADLDRLRTRLVGGEAERRLAENLHVVGNVADLLNPWRQP